MSVKYGTVSVSLFLLMLLLQNSYQRPFEMKKLQQFLLNYGFLHSTNDFGESEIKEGIKKFQRTVGLPITGDPTNETLIRLFGRRCGKPSNIPAFAEPRNRWRRDKITYKIRNTTSQLETSQIQNIVEDAIQEWTKYVNLQITESTKNNGDIDIYFTEQDGPSNTLGYAFYPENGDIFFDIDERWTIDAFSSDKTHFAWVATHELGHSLGLSHDLEFPDAVMFPYYSETVTKPSKRDINRLYAIYGPKIMENNILCNGTTTIDALLDTSSPILIKGKQYWRHSDSALKYGPFSAQETFPELPDHIDAAFDVNGVSYFFKDEVFYKFKTTRFSLRKKLISKGFDAALTHVDAAFFDKDKIIYFFKGSKYYTFNTKNPLGNRLVIKGKDISADWNGIPSNLEAATMLNNFQILFIKDNTCYKVDLNTKQLLSSEKCTSSFYKCKI